MDWKMKGTKTRILLLAGIIALLVFAFGYMQYHNLRINDIGIKVLSWVKKVRGKGVDLAAISQQDTPSIEHDAWTNLLEKYVDEKGDVDYQGFQQDSTELNQYLQLLSTHSPGRNWTEAEQLAYWINVYNAFTIKLIVDHYPLTSIKDIADGLPFINSPWDIKFFSIGGTAFDLNTVEHEILRKDFDEPRIHFAINCASVSCPKLRREAYTAAELESQLEEQTKDFFSNSSKNRITDSETRLSKIFDWFQSDFTKQSDLVTYIQGYKVELNPKNKIEFLDYDWGLNKQ